MQASRRVRGELHEVLCGGGVDAVPYWGKAAKVQRSGGEEKHAPEYPPDRGFHNLQSF